MHFDPGRQNILSGRLSEEEATGRIPIKQSVREK